MDLSLWNAAWLHTPVMGQAAWLWMVFGTVVVTVARMFVPNCSAAMVTKIAQ